MEKTNTFYSCPYCKTEYTEPSDLARCILSCEEKKRAEEEERKKAKLAAEKEKRRTEIEAKEKELSKLIASYIKDYGTYDAIRTSIDDNNSWIWRWVFS